MAISLIYLNLFARSYLLIGTNLFFKYFHTFDNLVDFLNYSDDFNFLKSTGLTPYPKKETKLNKK